MSVNFIEDTSLAAPEPLAHRQQHLKEQCSITDFGMSVWHLCTDLYENLVGRQVLSYKHKFQIS